MGASYFVAFPVAAEPWLERALAGAPPGVRRLHPDDVHLTLAFLGAVTEERARAAWRVVLENKGPDDFFGPRRGLDNAEFVLAGGGFPIWVKHAGMIGSLCVSGLQEREDHRLAVDAIADHLGLDKKALTLPPL